MRVHKGKYLLHVMLFEVFTLLQCERTNEFSDAHFEKSVIHTSMGLQMSFEIDALSSYYLKGFSPVWLHKQMFKPLVTADENAQSYSWRTSLKNSEQIHLLQSIILIRHTGRFSLQYEWPNASSNSYLQWSTFHTSDIWRASLPYECACAFWDCHVEQTLIHKCRM